MIPGIDTIIFDLDGVITDTASLHEAAWATVFNAFWQKIGMTNKCFTHSDYVRYVDGKAREKGALDYLSAYHIKLPIKVMPSLQYITIESICTDKNKIFEKILLTSPPIVFDDAELMLKRWHAAGYKIALVSSSRHCLNIIKRVGLSGYFQVILGGEEKVDLGLKTKTELFEKALQQLNSIPSKTIIIEDALSGVKAASQIASVWVIGLNRHMIDSGLYVENGAMVVVKNLEEFED